MKKYPTVGTIFSDGFSIFAKEWKLLIGLTLILMIPVYVLLFWAAPTNTTQILTAIFLLLFISPVLQILIAKIVESRYKHKKTHPWNELWNYVYKKYFDVLLTQLLLVLIFLIIGAVVGGLFAAGIYLVGDTGTITTGGILIPLGQVIIIGLLTILSILLFMILMTYLVFFNPVVVLTEKKYFSAILETYNLVKGRWWATFGRLLLLQLASLAIVWVLMIIFIPLELPYYLTEQVVPPGMQLIKTIVQQVIVLPLGVAGIAWYLRIK